MTEGTPEHNVQDLHVRLKAEERVSEKVGHRSEKFNIAIIESRMD